MTGRGLVTTQAGLPGDIALPSSCAKPSEAGAADLAARLGPDLARCAPTSSPPAARGPQFSGPAAATCLEKAGMQRRRGRGLPSCGPEELPQQRPNLRRVSGFRGRTQALGKLESSQVSPACHLASPPTSGVWTVRLSPGPSHAGAATANRASRLSLPSIPRPRFFKLPPTHTNPGDSAPQVGKGVRGSLLLGKEARACHRAR